MQSAVRGPKQAHDSLLYSALACIYYATYAVRTIYTVVEPRGWIDSTGWLSGDSECEWFGLSCDENSLIAEIVLVSKRTVKLALEGTRRVTHSP